MEKSNVGFSTPIAFNWIFKEDVSEIIESGYGLVSLVLAENVEWNDFYFTPGTEQWSEVSEEIESGLVWKQNFKIVAPKETILEWNEINQLARRKILVKLKFNEGNKLIGSIENPVSIVIDTDSTGGMQTGISFTRQSGNRAVWIGSEENSGTGG